MSHSILVRAPCRLHFGLMSFGHDNRPQFGGVGMMIDPPAAEVKIRAANEFTALGMLAERAEQFVQSAADAWQLSTLPKCEISVASPPNHVGLGVGTQLGLAVAAGLREFLSLPEMPVDQLAASVGRGTRSAVGTYGFQGGGLIVDAGKMPGRPLGQLAQRAHLPEAWRIVLARPGQSQGLAGDYEAGTFARLPPVPTDVTERLWQIATEEMVPAAELADSDAFGEAVYRYGRLAGECFASIQGGPYANESIAELVEEIRRQGVPGVGQSSWGPTVFAITGNESRASALATWLENVIGLSSEAVTIAAPNNVGAQIRTFS